MADYNARKYLKDKGWLRKAVSTGFIDSESGLERKRDLLRAYGIRNPNIRGGERVSLYDVNIERINGTYRTTVRQVSERLDKFKQLMRTQGLEAALQELHSLDDALHLGDQDKADMHDDNFIRATQSLNDDNHLLFQIYEQLKKQNKVNV